jgi:outer membrane receptor protein involved in Fe transport
MNDEFEDDPSLGSGALNRTLTRQETSGAALQWNRITARHQLARGTSFDHARVRFSQTQQLGEIDATRGVGDLQAVEEENRLHGTTRTASLYVADTIELATTLHLTAAARYNLSRVTTFDELDRTAPNLDGDHTYRKLNPALGLSWQVRPRLNVYAGLSQGTRIPTPIELGCADPENPCTLPNSMAADPYLKQVVSRTIEAGLRGSLGDALHWQAGVFRTQNTDDILFVGTSTSAGYFTNYGKTLRQGLELGLNGRARRLDWHVAYSWLHATFGSSACLLAENNSTRGTAPECTAGHQDDEILVRKDNKIPGLPEHSLKLGLSWRATDALRLGGDVQAFSSQYARGNENNQHQSGSATDVNGDTRDFNSSGKLAGYAILNLNADFKLGDGWQLFGKINNVFDQRYATAAALAENPFVAAGNGFDANSDHWRREAFVAPGAPRAAWVGVRYIFGGK